MIYTMVVLGYTVANLMITLAILFRSRHNILSQFYSFCVGCLIYLGIAGYFLIQPIDRTVWSLLYYVALFVYALIPFFFLHFIVIFVRRYEILRSKRIITAIYFVGLFSYAMILLHYIPVPITDKGTITDSGYIFYLTWMTIYFAIGVAMLYEIARGFYEKAGKANLLFISFVLLLLILPGPFTDSVFFNILHLGREWYYFSCTVAIVIAIYFIFRHKIIVNTLYDSLKSALAVVNDILITTNDSFQIEMVQGGVTSLLGFKEEELIGKNLTDFIDQGAYLSEYRDLVRRKKMKQSYFDTEMTTKNGTSIPMNFSFSPMMFGKEISGFTGIGRDMREHRKLAEQLRQAQKMESLGTLAGGVAHDFNNILQIMLVSNESLKKNLSDPQRAQKLVEIGREAIDRGTYLVQQILTFARKTDVLFSHVDPNAVVQEVVRLSSMTFPKTITFSEHLDAKLPQISADQNQLHQVLLNLLVNARDVMPDGGQIVIETSVVLANDMQKKYSEALDGSYVCISVSDTGIGMTEDVRSRIFEPFFTTKEKGKGTGLGLAVVYGIVKLHHGFIDVHTAVGKGTTFCIYIPNALHQTLVGNISGASLETACAGNETILVVEDEEVLRDFLKSSLEEKGYKVKTAVDGDDAVEVYQRDWKQIDLIVSDIGLPKQNGWNAIEKMTKLNPHLKAIVASGYFEPQQKKENNNGIYDFISKPYNPNSLLKSVRRVLDLQLTRG